ncbi:MAG: CehA/McbA family metallohydrolase [Acidobacteria bacterium]|nr:CehA/McbA family metallohydrolase [Bryobacteraceae bacterium CoA2 C42]
MRLCLGLVCALALRAEALPVIGSVERQPLAAQVERVVQALELAGEPFAERGALAGASVEKIQEILDKHCLVGLEINPEARVKVQQGPAKAELLEQGWRSFLVKVHNQAGLTAAVGVDSPNAGPMQNQNANTGNRRWMEIQSYTRQPLKVHLSGLAVEYRVIQIYAREAGQREAKLVFDVGQGTQDLGFRSEVDVLFRITPAAKLTLRVKDADGRPTTASFLVKDDRGRVYPSQAKRKAPDFFFHPQVYRADGESLVLPPGSYTVEVSRGPEYKKITRKVTMDRVDRTEAFQLERWVDPAKLGWISGDHHIHAAGCSHYERPTEGVYPQDMMRHVLGEDLKIGSVLTWGPGWYFQKTFFEGKDHALSTEENRIRYDVEISGHPSSHTGHLVLLGVKEQDYPGTARLEDWPTWGLPILQWAKKQGAVTGFAHSGWGLEMPKDELLSYDHPRFDGIGANEYIVSVTHGAVDFLSTVDTPWPWELNIWYHTLNAGYRTRISGETDFPCIYDSKVGLGRSYVRQAKPDYGDWIQGIKEGRNYVSDGRSHLIDFRVSNVEMGKGDVKLSAPARVTATVQVAALLNETPAAKRKANVKPYWDVEQARVGTSRKVPVELVVNGVAMEKTEVEADGVMREVKFTTRIERSSWVAVRVLPSSHTNPIWVTVGESPVRERKSIEWCLKAVDLCEQQKTGRVKLNERGEMARAYEYARQEYRKRLQ